MNASDILKGILKDDSEQYSKVCKVISVSGSVCDCEPIDGTADILDVKLQTEASKGFLIIPKVDSIVIITFTSDSTAYVAMYSTIEGIELNGNDYSLLKTEDFLTELNKLKQTVDALLNGFSSWTPVPNDGGAALKTVMTSQLAGKTTGDYSDVKNETIKHGDGS